MEAYDKHNRALEEKKAAQRNASTSASALSVEATKRMFIITFFVLFSCSEEKYVAQPNSSTSAPSVQVQVTTRKHMFIISFLVLFSSIPLLFLIL